MSKGNLSDGKRKEVYRQNELDCMASNKLIKNVEARIFTDGVLIMTKENKVVDFVKFYSKITAQKIEISKDNDPNKNYVIIKSPRRKSLTFRLIFKNFLDPFFNKLFETINNFFSTIEKSSPIPTPISSLSFGTNFATDVFFDVISASPVELKGSDKRDLV